MLASFPQNSYYFEVWQYKPSLRDNDAVPFLPVVEQM